MAASGASLLAVVVVFSMLMISSLGNSMPLCSDCAMLCNTNCEAEAKTSCSSNCYNPREDYQRQVFQGCTADGTCCSSNGTCTCDCNMVAQNACNNVTDGSTNYNACKCGMYDQCYPNCNNDCNNNCSKKGCNA